MSVSVLQHLRVFVSGYKKRQVCVYVCAACAHYFCLFVYSVFLSGTSYKCINHTKEKKMLCTSFG